MVLTTFPYVGEVGSTSMTARKSGDGGSSTASSLSARTGLTAGAAFLTSAPVVSPALSSPAQTTRYSPPVEVAPSPAAALATPSARTRWLVAQKVRPLASRV